jgi:DNA-binding Lrp family transcriptional regulator
MGGSWTFFTNHAHVLFVISEDPDMRLRDVAERVGITERATQRIVAELEQCGFLEHEKIGRRNRYHIVRDINLRHPIEAHLGVNELLQLFARD